MYFKTKVPLWPGQTRPKRNFYLEVNGRLGHPVHNVYFDIHSSHYKNLEELKRNPNYEYIHPPIAKYDSSQFALFDEIREVGYHHGSTFFTGLRRAGQVSPADVLQREVGGCGSYFFEKFCRVTPIRWFPTFC